MKQSIFIPQFKNHFIAFLAIILLVSQIFGAIHHASHDLKSNSDHSFKNNYSKNSHLSSKKNHSSKDHSNHQCLICSFAQFFKLSFDEELVLFFFNVVFSIFGLKKFQRFLKNLLSTHNLSRAPPKLV
ncbi:MAG: hypothetical protein FJX30_04205 [Alphaproteobacteria bacterium]|nr:hypothetical protein [Alphaproteobacteria bacterium]